MNKNNFFLMAILFFMIFSGCCQSVPEGLNVMSFNIRYDNPEDSINNWKYRKDYDCSMIRFYDVDIMGNQEVLNNQLDDLLAGLPDYDYIGVGRDDGKTKGEYSSVLYKRDKFQVEKSGTFWLSETPDEVGSKGWDAVCRRVVTWGIFRDKLTGKRFAFFNTHFDHRGKIAREKSASLLKERISSITGNNLPVIVTGDFNVEESSNAIQTILSGKTLFLARHESPIVYGPSYSFHGFGKVPVTNRHIIDHVFVNKKVIVDRYGILSEKKDSVYLSDHNPVFVHVNIK